MSSLLPPDPNAIKAGDDDPIIVTLSDANGPVNLSGASAALRMKNLGTGVEVALTGVTTILQSVGGTGQILNRGQVKYVWAAGETATPGVYGFDFLVTFADASTRSFPNDRLVTLRIVPAP